MNLRLSEYGLLRISRQWEILHTEPNARGQTTRYFGDMYTKRDLVPARGGGGSGARVSSPVLGGVGAPVDLLATSREVGSD